MLIKDARLKSFHAAAVHGSFTVAAENLFTSQQGISFHVRSLEEKIGEKLFVREQGGVSLTGAGQILFDYVQEIYDLAAEAEARLAEHSRSSVREIRVAATSSLAKYVLAGDIQRFREKFPNFSITLEVGNSTYCAECLRRGDVQVAFVSDGVYLEGLKVQPLFEDEILLIASREAHVTHGSVIDMPQFLGIPFVCRETGSGTRGILDGFLKAKGYSLSDMNLEAVMGSTEAVKSAVQNGICIGIVSSLSAWKELESGGLCKVELVGEKMMRTFCIALCDKYPPNKLTLDFVEQVKLSFVKDVNRPGFRGGSLV